MRILLDQSVHDHKNKGNNSLLEVALNRFRDFWPEASFEVISISPHFCRVYIPGTQPVDPFSLCKVERNLDAMHRVVPRPFLQLLFESRERLHSQTKLTLSPQDLRLLVPSRLRRDDPQEQYQEMEFEIEANVDAKSMEADQTPAEAYGNIANYDLYVATGGGYMCDFDEYFLFQMFDRLEAAVAHGVPAVMVGQGIGPLEDPILLARAKEVLPFIDYIMIREERVARPILDFLDVPQSKVIMTGDDAIELAYQARQNQLGTGIGLSLRIADYTQVNEGQVAAIRPTVLHAAKQYDAELVSAPIDVNESDHAYNEQIMEGYHKNSSSWKRFEATADIIMRISHCRVMIAGTFHGAVFALSQGIPVVALTKSAEYNGKISGLASEFSEAGCQVINLNDENMQKRLSEAIDFAWSSAEQLRPHLLEQAKRQIDLGNDAYQKIFDLVETRRHMKNLQQRKAVESGA